MRFILLIMCMVCNIALSQIHEKVVICGTVKNACPGLRKSIKYAEKIGSMFDDYRVIIYENNSSDKSPLVLRKWQKKNKRLFLMSERLTNRDVGQIAKNRYLNGYPFRIDFISYARNRVLDVLMTDEYDDYKYVIWLDMDFKIPPSFEGIKEVFKSDQEWDAVFAYGVHPSGAFYDWYALRDKKYPLGPDALGDYWWKMKKTLAFESTEDWYPVMSAFGGCGIYKRESMKGCRYDSVVTEDYSRIVNYVINSEEYMDNPTVKKYHQLNEEISEIVSFDPDQPQPVNYNDESLGFVIENDPLSTIWRMNLRVYRYPSICEHVTFHSSMAKNGHGKFFINPRMIFRYSY